MSKVHGWVSSPDGRGTMDLIWSCAATVLLCNWSVLCLNVPVKDSAREIWKTKVSWLAFSIFLPEVLAALAQNQWISARQSVSDFAALGFPQWSPRHAFFADMGGFVLRAPDYPPFPINGGQVYYLVANGFMDFPAVEKKTIWDMSKADSFSRVLVSVQLSWFGIQCVGRAVQRLPLSTFELDTVAFLVCTLPTFFFWYHKPLDVTTQIPLHLKDNLRIQDVLIFAGEAASKPFKHTPLDFTHPPPDPYELMDPIFWALEYLFGVGGDPKYVPITTFKNTTRATPRGTRVIDVTVFVIITGCYLGIHFVAWYFEFPTPLERTLWRAACLSLIATSLSYALLLHFVTWQLPRFRSLFRVPQAETGTELFAGMHPVFQYLIAGGWVGSYGIARLYLIIEAFLGLRTMPSAIFETVEWSNYFPHI